MNRAGPWTDEQDYRSAVAAAVYAAVRETIRLEDLQLSRWKTREALHSALDQIAETVRSPVAVLRWTENIEAADGLGPLPAGGALKAINIIAMYAYREDLRDALDEMRDPEAAQAIGAFWCPICGETLPLADQRGDRCQPCQDDDDDWSDDDDGSLALFFGVVGG